VALEASGEYGMNSTDFIAAMVSLDVSRWSNIRQIRMHIRDKAKPVADPLPESRIWPLEVGIVFDQVDGADMLDESQQNKLKANINQLWLERTATSEIITAASELVRSMRGEAA
ncbi:TPA: phage N-6-adenine-methyltransferase, partial [Citrobacter freundii]|nr:phage N-6-adenine-methyltransferase [Citrobacter freundii]